MIADYGYTLLNIVRKISGIGFQLVDVKSQAGSGLMEIQARRASFEVAHFAVFSSTNPAKYEPDAQASELIGDVILAAKTSGSATISLACAAGLYQVCNFKTRKRGVGTIPRLRVELVLKPLVQLLAAISSGQAGSLCHNEEPTVIFRSMLKK